jgi:hypothetical protein
MKNLTEKAMLLSLNISCWSARKFDKELTKELEESHGAYDSGRFNKLLIDKAYVNDIQRIASEARKFHYYNTLAWGKDNQRILLSVNYFDYMEKINEFSIKFSEEVKNFKKLYKMLIDRAQVRLNSMFNSSDYPTVEELKYKYGFSVDVNPIPAAGDFRVNLNADEVAEIQKNIEKKQHESIAAAMKDVWKRLYEIVSHMSEKLHQRDGIFRDSLVDNVIKLAQMLPKLNLTDDPELMKIKEEVEQKLSADPENIRNNKGLRLETAENADEILKKMEKFVA